MTSRQLTILIALPLITIAGLVCESAYCRISGNTFIDGKSGFAISKPADWEFVQTAKSSGIELKNNQLTAAEGEHLITFSKKMGEGFSGVPPTAGVKILTKAKPGLDLVKWLTDELNSQATHDKYFFPGSTAISTSIDGENGARASYVNSTIIKGNEVHVYHVLYLVPVGGKVYLIHLDCNEALENKFIDVFSEIAGSIQVNAE